MTVQEANKRFHIKAETLQLYLESGLLEDVITADGLSEFVEEDLQKILQFQFLLEAGIDVAMIRRLIQLTASKTNTKEEQVKLLRKCRYQILEQIHSKQQCLDQLDYHIHEILQV